MSFPSSPLTTFLQLLSYKASNKMQRTEKDFLGSRKVLGGTALLDVFERIMKSKKKADKSG